MRILVSNDDGIQALGIQALARALGAQHDVTVVAPDRENSAISHKITYEAPVTVLPHALADFAGAAYSVSGTPADCVKVALGGLLEQPPDMVIAGINHGSNLANDIPYSGTLSAAREAAMLGLPAIGVSCCLLPQDWLRASRGEGIAHIGTAARFAVQMAAWLRENPLPKGCFLNVNVPNLPPEELRGVRVTPQGYFHQRPQYRRRPTEGGENYTWEFCKERPHDRLQPDSDIALIKQGFLTVTPLTWQQTHQACLQALKAQAANWMHFGGKDCDA